MMLGDGGYYGGASILEVAELSRSLVEAEKSIYVAETKLSRHQAEAEKTLSLAEAVNPNTLYTGLFLPENILIHVAQNFINFIASTLVWAILVLITQVQCTYSSFLHRGIFILLTQVQLVLLTKVHTPYTYTPIFF